MLYLFSIGNIHASIKFPKCQPVALETIFTLLVEHCCNDLFCMDPEVIMKKKEMMFFNVLVYM